MARPLHLDLKDRRPTARGARPCAGRSGFSYVGSGPPCWRVSPKLAFASRRDAATCHGFTLLEVILALVVLGAALAIFGEVMQLANRAAVDSRAETQAQLMADTLMDEILAGVRDKTQVTRQALESTDATAWLYSVSVGTADVQGVFPLEVRVEQDLEPQFTPVSYRIVRWLPTVAESDESLEESDANQQSSRQGSGTSGSGAGSGSGSASGAGTGGATGS